MSMAGWKCDICGLEWNQESPRYTIMDDERAQTFRHWDCHETRNTQLQLDLAEAKRKLDRALDLCEDIRRKMK